MKIIKVMIAGGGGIGSWLVQELDRLRKHGQIGPMYQFTIFDNDTVEQKNLPYQNYDELDLLDYKARSLGERYIMNYENIAVSKPTQFDLFDIVISGVDNSKFRRMLFTYMSNHPEKYWIDLRAEGTQMAFYTKHKSNTLDALIKTLPDKTTDNNSTSCQRSWELNAGVVQLGNKIIAVIAAQLFLNNIRGEANPASYTHIY
jgi:hypothetical protein